MISQSYCQKQNIQITPQRIQLLNFFALNVLELEAQIKTELEENPFLESAIDENSLSIDNPEPDIPDCQDWEAYSEEMLDKQIEYQNYINKAVLPDRPLICHRDFKEDAKQQLRMLALDESLYDLTVYIIDTLNDHGLLDQPLCEVVESYSFHSLNWVDISKAEEALRIVQQLEPIGIGATSIRECLLMQLRKSCPKNEYADLAIRLIEDNYEELVKKQFEKICHRLNISDEILKSVFAYLRRFKLHPVCEMAYSNEAKQTLVPDFIITNHDNGISVELCSSKSHSLRLNSSLYTQVKETSSKKDKSAERYARNKIATAEWFIGNVKQREETMLKTMRIIVNFQYQFFRTGDVMSLKPMVLKDIADITGYDISTLSRITTNKYADTHFGIIYLKDLFNEGIKDQSGAVVSNKVIQSLIKDAISGEDKSNPYTDQKLTTLLAEMGYNVARRTVTKYREKLNIPIAQVRHVSARN